jgi:hypothetical protein
MTNRLVNQNASQEGKKKIVTGSGKEDRDIKHVFCPECQGAGLISADQLEHPKFCSLSQVFVHYMENPFLSLCLILCLI